MRTERQRYRRLLEQKDFMLRAERRAYETRASALTGSLRELERAYRDVESQTKSLRIQQRSVRRSQAGEIYIQFQKIARSVQQREQIAAERREISERIANLGAKIRSQRKLEEVVAEKLGKVDLLVKQDSKAIESRKLIASALRRKLSDQESQGEGKELSALPSGPDSFIQPTQVVSEILKAFASLHHFQERVVQVGAPTGVLQYSSARFTNQTSNSSLPHPNVHCQYQLASSRECVDIVATLIAPGQVQVQLITSGSASSKLIRTAQNRLRQLFAATTTTQVNFSVEERWKAQSQLGAEPT